MKTAGCLGFRRLYYTAILGIIVNHYKDPLEKQPVGLMVPKYPRFLDPASGEKKHWLVVGWWSDGFLRLL